MKNYGASTLQELKKEYALEQKTVVKEISHNCYEADFQIDLPDNIYTIQFTKDEKILGIWDSDGGKIEKI